MPLQEPFEKARFYSPLNPSRGYGPLLSNPNILKGSPLKEPYSKALSWLGRQELAAVVNFLAIS